MEEFIDKEFLQQKKKELLQSKSNFENAAEQNSSNAKACAGAIMFIDELIGKLDRPESQPGGQSDNGESQAD